MKLRKKIAKVVLDCKWTLLKIWDQECTKFSKHKSHVINEGIRPILVTLSNPFHNNIF